MNREWMELESDPGLFTLLLEDIGAKGVQVEEIYDLQKEIEGPVYGFIFLFKWIEERRARRKIGGEDGAHVQDEDIVNEMFFARQVMSNSCATHALISVLLNCEQIAIGETLQHLKEFSHGMTPDDKGHAISNMPDLAKAHNSHARPEPRRLADKQTGIASIRTRDAFHFVSFVPIKDRLFELDGLKPYPIDHGPWGEHEEWQEKFRRVIAERLGMVTGGKPYHDIRFNLMAVVPEKIHHYEHKLATLKTNRQIVQDALQQLVDSKVVNVTQEPGKPLAPERAIKTRSAARRENQTKSTQGASSAGGVALTGKGDSTNSSQQSTDEQSPASQGTVDSSNDTDTNDLITQDGTAGSTSGRSDSVERGTGDISDVNSVDELSLSLNNKHDHSLVMDSGEKMPLGQIQADQLTPVKDKSVKIEISISGENGEGSITQPTTVATTDVTKPLIINTKFAASPGPGSESTDTASEMGSIFNSPNSSATMSCQSSPSLPPSLKTSPAPGAPSSALHAHNLPSAASHHTHPPPPAALPPPLAAPPPTTAATATPGPSSGSGAEGATATPAGSATHPHPPPSVGEDTSHATISTTAAVKQEGSSVARDVKPTTQHSRDSSATKDSGSSSSGSSAVPSNVNASTIDKSPRSKLSSQQGFTPKDLLALLKTVNSEIEITESLLRDEVEKRKKYKIDDCRRTHCYDQFICTFLSMLAEQGHLAGLVEQQHKRLVTATASKKTTPDKRKKAKTKKKK